MKLQLKSPNLWLLFQRCVAEVRKPEMKEKELSRVLQLINISCYSSEKNCLLKCSQNCHHLLLIIFFLNIR